MLHNFQLEKSTSVVVIGGGAVGIEMAGEIQAQWVKRELRLKGSLIIVINYTQYEI